MLARPCLVQAGIAVARAQSCAVRIRPGLSQTRSPRLSPAQFSRLLSDHQAAPLQEAPKQPSIQPKKAHRPYKPRNIQDIGRLVAAPSNGSFINLNFQHHNCTNIPHIWFRDSCPCAHCVSESSGQKNFATCDVDPTPKLESSKVLADGSLELVWARDFMGGKSHTSTFTPSFLESMIKQHAGLPDIFPPQRYLWDRPAFEKNMEARTISYEAWMAGGESFAKGLLDLCQWGLIIVKGVPESRDAVKDVANKIGHLQSTFYGETWDVISKPNAENVAYTNEFLCLHQDLMYYDDIPYVQLLHCMKNDCEGGDSLFSDGLRAAVELKHHKPNDYSFLTKKPIFFQYSKNGHSYRRRRRVINDSYDSSPDLPSSIHWSPPFQGPFPLKHMTKSLVQYSRAAKTFKENVEASDNMLKCRLQPGDCVLFDNSRVLHGRTKFDTSSGLRHLHGAYLQRQTVLSALRREVERGHIDRTTFKGWSAEADTAKAWLGLAAGEGHEQS